MKCQILLQNSIESTVAIINAVLYVTSSLQFIKQFHVVFLFDLTILWATFLSIIIFTFHMRKQVFQCLIQSRLVNKMLKQNLTPELLTEYFSFVGNAI